MRVWRISQKRYSAFDGEGGRRASGRWHRQGVPVIYASDTLALAALEYFVRLNPGDAEAPLAAVSADIPGDLAIDRIQIKEPPKDWNTYPAPRRLQSAGMKWLGQARTAVLAVPSAVIPQQTNYLINPSHADFKRIRVNKAQVFRFDPRMWE